MGFGARPSRVRRYCRLRTTPALPRSGAEMDRLSLRLPDDRLRHGRPGLGVRQAGRHEPPPSRGGFWLPPEISWLGPISELSTVPCSPHQGCSRSSVWHRQCWRLYRVRATNHVSTAGLPRCGMVDPSSESAGKAAGFRTAAEFTWSLFGEEFIESVVPEIRRTNRPGVIPQTILSLVQRLPVDEISQLL